MYITPTLGILENNSSNLKDDSSDQDGDSNDLHVDGGSDDLNGESDDLNGESDDLDEDSSEDDSYFDDAGVSLIDGSSSESSSSSPNDGTFNNVLFLTVHRVINFIGRSQSLLYDGSSINKETSWYSIMNYAVANNLSYKAIEDLIQLIKVCTSIQPQLFYEWSLFVHTCRCTVLHQTSALTHYTS